MTEQWPVKITPILEIDEEVESPPDDEEHEHADDDPQPITLDEIDKIVENEEKSEKKLDKPTIPRYIVENGKKVLAPGQHNKINAVNKNIDNSKDIDKEDILRRN